MRKIQIKIGTKTNRLTYIGNDITENGKRKGLYVCDCGNEKYCVNSEVVKQTTRSCGCYNRELASKKLTKAITKHGLSRTPIYGVYKSIKQRCFDKNCNSYYRYGFRGITICQEWLNDFKSFYDWCLLNGYKKGLEIDRINNDGDYEPKNCRLVEKVVNINNTSKNVFVYFYGERMTIGQLSTKTGVHYSNLYRRIIKFKIIPEMAVSLSSTDIIQAKRRWRLQV